MQNPKIRKGPSEVPEKVSPRSRFARNLNITAVNPISTPSLNQASRTPKERSPKVIERKSPISPKVAERKSPRSPVAEALKKRPIRFSELEDQLTEIREHLKKAKDELSLSETLKNQAQQEAEVSKQKLLDISTKLEDSQKQIRELTASEVSHTVELQKNSEEKDLTTQIEATPTQHIQSEHEIQSLKNQMAETLLIVDDMKKQLGECKESEAQAQALVIETLQQLETAKLTVETLRLDGVKSMEKYHSIATELQQSKENVNLLEKLVSKFNSDFIENGNISESDKSEPELISLKSEVKRLEAAIEAAEVKHNEEQIRSSVEIKTVYELVEEIKCKSSKRETELETELEKYKSYVEELQANLMDKETELQAISEENEGLKSDFKKSSNKTPISDLKVTFTEDLELKKSGERDSLTKLAHLTEQAEMNRERVVQVTEQLEATQAVNAEMEAELRRLKVQSNQWRKAAEAAAAMVSAGHPGKFIDRTGSLDSNYNPVIGSPFSDDTDDDVLKKKNGNVLKKIGVLWKRPQK